MDSYFTLTHEGGSAQFVEKRSRFLAFAHHVESEEDVKALVTRYRKEYYDARHVCFSYILGVEGEHFRAVDDGEPGGSAGKPILGQIRSRNLTDTLVVVVRYFGGVKLGTGGLAVAYKTAAGDALDNAAVEERIVKEEMQVETSYALADTVMKAARNMGAEIRMDYTADAVVLKLKIRKSEIEKLNERVSHILCTGDRRDA